LITIICGDPGTGKTALMTSFALKRMSGAAARCDVLRCRSVVRRLNKTGYNLTVPRRHLVFTDYSVMSHCVGGGRGTPSHRVDGFYIGLPNSQHPTVFLPPYSFVCLDEAQKYYYSRENNKLADFVSRFYETHRHYYLNIVLACQRPGLIDKNIRCLSEQFIFIDKLKHTTDRFGSIVKSRWSCIEFNNSGSAEKYSDGKISEGGKRTEYTFEGSIFAAFNSFEFFGLHIESRETADFDLIPRLLPPDLDKYSYEVPKTFYKKH
jgi:hypothetical protein